jgi:hypothetical protein
MPVLVGEFGRPRHPVTVEIVGSNPIEDAYPTKRRGTVRKPAKRRSSNLREFVGSTPTRATDCEGGRSSCRADLRWAEKSAARREPRPPETTDNKSRRLGIGAPKWL